MQEQFDYYLKHKEEFLKKYEGKAIVLKDFEVVETNKSEWEAFKKASKKYKQGTFIVQKVLPGTEAYTVVISSNFVYAGK